MRAKWNNILVQWWMWKKRKKNRSPLAPVPSYSSAPPRISTIVQPPPFNVLKKFLALPPTSIERRVGQNYVLMKLFTWNLLIKWTLWYWILVWTTRKVGFDKMSTNFYFFLTKYRYSLKPHSFTNFILRYFV